MATKARNSGKNDWDKPDNYNAKNSAESEGYGKTTGVSSAQPKDKLGPMNSATNMSAESETARQSRLGNTSTKSGPKPASGPGFLKHTVKDMK